MTSPYLRRPSLPQPKFLTGDHVITGFGLGVVESGYWCARTGNPHWRFHVNLIDGASADCSADGVRKPAVSMREAA